MDRHSKIYIAGHSGMVGSALLSRLKREGFSNLVTRSHTELDLTDQSKVINFFNTERPEYVFMAAGIGGGIMANINSPADFIYKNIQLQNNVIDAAYRSRVKRLFFFACSCIYPAASPQPIKEDYLLAGPLEPSSESFALAKIAGIKMCQSYNRQYKTDFISLVPSNIYGPTDKFNLETSHVVSALLMQFHAAKSTNKKTVMVFGSGAPERDFLFIDDLAEACLFLSQKDRLPEIINIGSGFGTSIRQLAELIKRVVKFRGEIGFDKSKPDGTVKKILDCQRLGSLGYRPSRDLLSGLEQTYRWYEEKIALV